MRNLVIFITGTLAAVAIFAAVWAGHSFYKECRFRSYLKAVGLPTETGYMGGDYPKWEPVEFTYKEYKSDIPINSLPFRESIIDNMRQNKEIYSALGCTGFHWRLQLLPDDEVERLAVTDPDAMYVMFLRLIVKGDENTALLYLHRAASLGHIMSNIDLIVHYSGASDDEKAKKLIQYAKVTPDAVGPMLRYNNLPYSYEELAGMMRMSNSCMFLSNYILEELGDTIFFRNLPERKDFECELIYRGSSYDLMQYSCEGH